MGTSPEPYKFYGTKKKEKKSCLKVVGPPPLDQPLFVSQASKIIGIPVQHLEDIVQ